jgi:hypothetical protein
MSAGVSALISVIKYIILIYAIIVPYSLSEICDHLANKFSIFSIFSILIVSSEDDFYIVQKLNRSLRNVKYKVKPTEVYPVTPTINDDHVIQELDEDDGEEEIRVVDYQPYDDPVVPLVDQQNPDVCDIDPVGGNPATIQQAGDAVPDVQAVPPAACHDAPLNSTIIQDAGSRVTEDEVHLGSVESSQGEVPPAGSRPKRNVRPPKRFEGYVMY